MSREVNTATPRGESLEFGRQVTALMQQLRLAESREDEVAADKLIDQIAQVYEPRIQEIIQQFPSQKEAASDIAWDLVFRMIVRFESGERPISSYFSEGIVRAELRRRNSQTHFEESQRTNRSDKFWRNIKGAEYTEDSILLADWKKAKEDIQKLVHSLGSRKEEVMQMRGRGFTLQEVADQLGIASREWIRQLEWKTASQVARRLSKNPEVRAFVQDLIGHYTIQGDYIRDEWDALREILSAAFALTD